IRQSPRPYPPRGPPEHAPPRPRGPPPPQGRPPVPPPVPRLTPPPHPFTARRRVSVLFRVSRAPARRPAVETLVASAITHHQGAAVGTARRIGLGTECDGRLSRRQAGRETDGMARRRPRSYVAPR